MSFFLNFLLTLLAYHQMKETVLFTYTFKKLSCFLLQIECRKNLTLHLKNSVLFEDVQFNEGIFFFPPKDKSIGLQKNNCNHLASTEELYIVQARRAEKITTDPSYPGHTVTVSTPPLGCHYRALHAKTTRHRD